MESNIEKEMDHLAEAAQNVNEEIEFATDDDATIEEIEGARTLAADLLNKYDAFLNRLSPEERADAQRRIGLVVEKMKGKLTRLKEAPE